MQTVLCDCATSPPQKILLAKFNFCSFQYPWITVSDTESLRAHQNLREFWPSAVSMAAAIQNLPIFYFPKPRGLLALSVLRRWQPDTRDVWESVISLCLARL
jgi:hypothetical protein